MLKHSTTRTTNICADGARVFALATAFVVLVHTLGGTVWAQPQPKALPILTHAEQIRSLSPGAGCTGLSSAGSRRNHHGCSSTGFLHSRCDRWHLR